MECERQSGAEVLLAECHERRADGSCASELGVINNTTQSCRTKHVARWCATVRLSQRFAGATPPSVTLTLHHASYIPSAPD